jgi:hypothetical protein
MGIEWLGAAGWREPSGLTAYDFCGRAIMRRATGLCGVSIAAWRGREALLIGLAATARGLVVASDPVHGIGTSAEVMRCRDRTT